MNEGPTIRAGEDRATIVFGTDGPIVPNRFAARPDEHVRLRQVTVTAYDLTKKTRRLFSGRGLVIRKDGSTGTAVRDYVSVDPACLPPGILKATVAAMVHESEKHLAELYDVLEGMES